MKLPQFDQKLELWPGDCLVLAQLLARWVQLHVGQAQAGRGLSRGVALMLKPASRLSLRLLRLANQDAMLQRRQVRRVRLEYDELLVLNAVARNQAVPTDQDTALRLVGHIDQKSLSLTPHFTR